MNKERLLRLADFLEKDIPREKFNLDVWCSGEWYECGTTACACGWATQIPEFAEAGFKLIPFRCEVDGERYFSSDLYFQESYGFDAVTDFFSIHRDSARYLFYNQSYPEDGRSLNDVVARIRNYVETRS